MLRTKRLMRLSIILVLLGVTAGAFGQSLMGDIINNDLAAVAKKEAVLKPTYKEEAYLATYLGLTKHFSSVTVDYLLAHGADPNQVDDSGMGPLYYAAFRNFPEAIDRLIAAKANLNTIWTKKVEVTRSLIVTDENIEKKTQALEKKDFYKETVLSAAAFNNNVPLVERFLAAGVNPLIVDKHYWDRTASSVAAPKYVTESVFSRAVDVLRANGNAGGQLAVAMDIWRAAQSRLAKAKTPFDTKTLTGIANDILLGRSANVKATLLKDTGSTLDLIPIAILAQNAETLHLLYDYNSIKLDDAVFVVQDYGRWQGKKLSAIGWAALVGSVTALKFLLDQGADPAVLFYDDSIKKDGYFHENEVFRNTLVGYAANTQSVELLAALVAGKVSLDAGYPLQFCSVTSPVGQALIAGGANPKLTFVQDGQKTTVDYLFTAAARGDAASVQYYLDQGVSPNRSKAASPLLAAIMAHSPDAVAALLKAGADTNVSLPPPEQVNLDNNLYNTFGRDGGGRGNALTFAKEQRRVSVSHDYVSHDYAGTTASVDLDAIIAQLTAAKSQLVSAAAAFSTSATAAIAGPSAAAPAATDSNIATVLVKFPKKPFFMETTTVPQALYQQIMGSNPSYFKGDDLPVETVYWSEALKFCNALSQRDGLDEVYSDDLSADLTKNGWRLPTTAEWEFAARSGKGAPLIIIVNPFEIDGTAWYQLNSDEKTHPVGTKKPNAFGLYDMIGNVYQWCNDRDRQIDGYAVRGSSFHTEMYRSSATPIPSASNLPGSIVWTTNNSAEVGFRVVRNANN